MARLGHQGRGQGRAPLQGFTDDVLRADIAKIKELAKDGDEDVTKLQVGAACKKALAACTEKLFKKAG